MTVTQLAIPVIANPLLRWVAVAEHARAAHGARWASDEDAVRAVVGAFDGILPSACGYSPATGVIATCNSQAVAVLGGWGDVPRLACAVAALAASLPSCDLEALLGTRNLVA